MPESTIRCTPLGFQKPGYRIFTHDRLRVIDAATIMAGPIATMVLGDFGADVIRVEHPTGDALRNLGYKKNNVPLWWKR